MTGLQDSGAPLPPPGHTHVVQFYESDDFLAELVGGFLAEGATKAEPLMVIATRAHGNAFVTALGATGVDVDSLRTGGRLTFLDARQTLARFMSGATLDEQLFQASVGTVLAMSAGTGETPVRVYSEMVDLLWCDGNPEAAVRLEELWNDLAGHHRFSILCANPIENFYKESEISLFDDLCNRHSEVYPTEGYIRLENEEIRNREIVRLRQRAVLLEAEVKQRKRLEVALRDSVVGRGRFERELRAFVENAAVGMHSIGADGTILWANAAELRLLGYTHEEYVGHNIAEFHIDREAAADILKRLTRHEPIHAREVSLIAKDGSTAHVAISSNVLFKEGTFFHIHRITHDVNPVEAERAHALEALSARLIAAQEEERTRVAREIHDQLGQLLTAAKIEISSMKPAEAAERIPRALMLIDQTIESVRRIATDLRPAVLDQFGLVPALENEVGLFQLRSGIECELSIRPPSIVLDPERSTAVFRVAQEAMTNVVRHARATRLEVRLRQSPGETLLEVRDDGIGIDPAAIHSNHSLGLIGIRERVRQIGGSVAIEGVPGRGTIFVVRIPTPAREA